MNNDTNKSGFALLMTLIVVGVVLSVGLSLLDLSIKQANLSTNAKESEIAFHAANAGLECAHYSRRTHRNDIRAGNDIDIECFNSSDPNVSADSIPSGFVSGDGTVYRYDYELTWGAPDARCTDVSMLAMFADIDGTTDLTISNNGLRQIFPEYRESDAKTCESGEQCTVIAVRGYNRPCSTKTGYGAIQRQVLLEF